MIIYNVSVKVELRIHDLWLRWMKEEHIPRVLETGCFKDAHIYRILEENTGDGISYAIMYRAENIEKYFDYKHQYASGLQKEALDLFPDGFTAFRTLLKEV